MREIFSIKYFLSTYKKNIIATPNWSNGSVGLKESRSQVPDPQPQIPNVCQPNMNIEYIFGIMKNQYSYSNEIFDAKNFTLFKP